MRYTLITLLLCLSLRGTAQDTLNLMFYNLLQFPGGTPIENRIDTLAKILDYVNPDVLMVCELYWENGTTDDLILEKALNRNGLNEYTMAVFIEDKIGSSGNLHNMLFYKQKDMGLKSQDIIETDTRDISNYKIWIGNNPEVIDTTWLDIFVAHFKAGTGDNNERRRKAAADALVGYINTHDISENRIFGADFNIRNGSEPAYQNLLTIFEDPIKKFGRWYSNTNFKNIHTQSTRATTDETRLVGGAHGGLDDRLDQILVSNSMMTGSSGIKYIPGTYEALGNDGSYYNRSLFNQSIQGIPDSIQNALYYMSDHLPVIMKVSVSSLSVGLDERKRDDTNMTVSYLPDRKIMLEVRNYEKPLTYQMRDIWGRLLYKSNSFIGSTYIDKKHHTSGIYILEVYDAEGIRLGYEKILVGGE